jgi:hypothetical protein
MKATVSIPSPCSEDWNKMTATDKGAFCAKCQFEVVDFTEKQPEEIKSILKERAGSRTCGHISPVQMEMLNSDYHLWDNQSFKVFRSKFLYACIMVFGMTLFSGCSDAVSKDFVGEIEDVGIITEEADTLNSCDAPDSDMVVLDGEMEFLEDDLE